jgi:hypothetical protein
VAPRDKAGPFTIVAALARRGLRMVVPLRSLRSVTAAAIDAGLGMAARQPLLYDAVFPSIGGRIVCGASQRFADGSTCGHDRRSWITPANDRRRPCLGLVQVTGYEVFVERAVVVIAMASGRRASVPLESDMARTLATDVRMTRETEVGRKRNRHGSRDLRLVFGVAAHATLGVDSLEHPEVAWVVELFSPMRVTLALELVAMTHETRLLFSA